VRTLPPGHDVLLYDGACRLCRRAVTRVTRVVPETTATHSFREAGVLPRFPRLDVPACEAAIQLVREDGMVFAGVEALVQALRRRWYGRLLRLYYLPGIRSAADAVYASVARHRFELSAPGARLTRA
jgi:predicted DCC family thiol-disulfide oxidoreductase YuxK